MNLKLRGRRLRRLFRPYRLPDMRRWQSDIRFRNQWSVYHGVRQHSWRGVSMHKHPVELALYPLLFWEMAPGTIFEIGSFAGGSAIFFADVIKAYGRDVRIVSVDINPPDPPLRPASVEFLRGDAANLGAVLTPDRLAACPRPWLVIEDSSHLYADTLAVLRFFDPLMRAGELIVVEDGVITDMGLAPKYDGGPARAIEEFLRDAGSRFVIDRDYCDRYGHNFTGNPNGYLRRR